MTLLARVALASALSAPGCVDSATPAVMGDESTGGDDDGSSSGPGSITIATTIDPTTPTVTLSDGDDDGASGDDDDDRGTGSSAGEAGDSDSGEPVTTSDASSGGAGSGSSDGGTGSSSGGGGESSSGAGPGSSSEGGGESSSEGGGESSSEEGGSTGGCPPVAGTYADCVDDEGDIDVTPCGGADPTCIFSTADPPTFGVCSQNDCDDECDCPTPATGDAPPTCGDLTGDTIPECYLDCSAGQDCPTGMDCAFADFCVHAQPGAEGTPYGDCLNNPVAVCGLDQTCLTSGMPAVIGVCAGFCPGGVGSCDPSPGGTAPVACDNIAGGTDDFCYIDCSAGGTCPAGMVCFASLLCAWD